MLNFLRKKIGIIGYGNMGQAIAEQIKYKYVVCVFDKDKNKITALKNITVSSNPADLVKQSEVIILAVKPQDFDILLNKIKIFLRSKLIISIAAGITTGYIEKILGKVRVVRVMPNIAAKIAEAETSLCQGKHAQEKDLDFAKTLFSLLGKVWVVKEEKIDAVTAISGSGPAYILYHLETENINPLNVPEEFVNMYIQRLNDAAIAVRLAPKIARELAVSTTASTIHLIKQTGSSPVQLRQMITSVGGTTEAAIKVITNGGSWPEAALAAQRRAQELSIKACLPAGRE